MPTVAKTTHNHSQAIDQRAGKPDLEAVAMKPLCNSDRRDGPAVVAIRDPPGSAHADIHPVSRHTPTARPPVDKYADATGAVTG